jgi:hypothetical protein
MRAVLSLMALLSLCSIWCYLNNAMWVVGASAS